MKWNSSPDVFDIDGYYVLTLQAETTLRTRNTGSADWSNSERFVVKASDVYAYEWSGAAEDWVLVEQVDFMNPTSISISGNQCDCNATVQKYGVAPGTTTEITPTVSGRNNYTYTMSAQRTKVVYLARAYHPNFNQPPMLGAFQNLFIQVSNFLGQDSDGCISEFDFRVQPGSATFDPVLYRSDDVPVYVDFHVADNPPTLLTFRPLNGIDFTQNIYFELNNEQRISELIQSGMVEIMQVSSILGGAYGGGSVPGSGRIVLAADANAKEAGHEWGHARGLNHRGEGANLPANSNNDPEALMHWNTLNSDTEVNRFERGALQEAMY